MFKCIHKITCGDYDFNVVRGVRISSHRSEPVTKAIIQLPYYKSIENAKFAKGDEVEIYLGYDRYGLKREFKGRLQSWSKDQPLELVCEDDITELRDKIIKRNHPNSYASDVIRYVIQGTNIKAGVIENGLKSNWAYYSASGLFAITRLAKHSGYDAFMTDNVLYFGPPFALVGEQLDIPKFEYGKNIIEKSSRKLFWKESRTIGQVIVRGEDLDGGKVWTGKYPASPENDKVISRYFTGITTKQEAQDRAKALFIFENFTGYYGSFETFGYPFVQHSTFVDITDPDEEDRSGRYGVDGTEVIYNHYEGFKRVVDIGLKDKDGVIQSL